MSYPPDYDIFTAYGDGASRNAYRVSWSCAVPRRLPTFNIVTAVGSCAFQFVFVADDFEPLGAVLEGVES